jgi:hypothetical protein
VRNRARRRWPWIALALAAPVVALAVLLWLARARPGAGPASPAADFVLSSGARSAVGRAPSIDPLAPEAANGLAPTTEREAVEPAASVPAVDVRVRAPGRDLVARFVSPDGKDLVLPFATLALADRAGNRRPCNVRGASSVTIPGLTPGHWTIDVRAPGFVHRVQVVEIQPKEPFTSGRVGPGSTLDAVNECIVLWPEGWIPVVARTPDGRPFRQLALDLGVEPKRLFVGSFDVITRDSPPDSGASENGSSPAIFVPPPGYPSWELPDGAIGSLRLRRPSPFWAGLKVLGEQLGWQLVQPGDVEVVFELGLEDFDARCARLRLRVIDALTKVPLPDAEVTLRADNSAHRREDQHEIAPDDDGVVELRRILPGRYELTVERGEAQHQQRIVVKGRETLDLGDVALAQGPGIKLLVLDERGQPARAYIEIAPYAPGKRVDELYPPMLHRRSDADGKYRLARPAIRSIDRARDETSTSRGQPVRGARTENVLIDPEALPAAPLVLRLREPVAVSFEFATQHRVEVADELGVVVVWVPSQDSRARRRDVHLPPRGQLRANQEASLRESRELLPGRYTARFPDEAGEVSGESIFYVGTTPSTVRGP